MAPVSKPTSSPVISTIQDFSQLANYSFIRDLKSDPESTQDGNDYKARQVRSGHFVPVKPTPLPNPVYVAHSQMFFSELGLSDQLIENQEFQKIFSGDLSSCEDPMQSYGWATGYALSIYGTEYNQQCPFGNGNGYGDGRAISIFEGIIGGDRWEMQLKGGGPTPYCRGADGRAILRSSVREFLAQELMHALGVPTSRSFTLYVSETGTVRRPWYSENSSSNDPDILVEDPIAIATRVAPSFLRVGQMELFARRARNSHQSQAHEELRLIVTHLIEREYKREIDQTQEFPFQCVQLARLYKQRLVSLVAHWIRVGYCQGNFNSDNCAAGGFTLDYGPFGFCEVFDPEFQPWIGGGKHFSLFNQPAAAEANFVMFWKAIRTLLKENKIALENLDIICSNFKNDMNQSMHRMWSDKLGLKQYNPQLVHNLVQLMIDTQVDFTIFFRELSQVPSECSEIQKSFYAPISQQLELRWNDWIHLWRQLLAHEGERPEISKRMRQINPKYTWREWLVAPAYQAAKQGDYSLIKELQDVFSCPYEEQSKKTEEKYYRLKPDQFFYSGGISHYSCSS